MTLPGMDWLRRQLAGVDDVLGGHQNNLANPVALGAGFSMSAIFVALWLLALPLFSLCALGQFIARRIAR